MALINQTNKIENGGVNAQGKLSAAEYVELVEEVIEIDDTAVRIGEVDGVGGAVIDEETGQHVDLSSYALKSWVENKGYLSSQSLKTINGQSIVGTGNINIAGGEGGGDANIIEIIKVNGSVLSVDSNKAVDITAIPASIVTQDATHRFVTDAEKSAWDAKPSTDTDTKNTAGATDITLNTGEKVYLVGAKEQTANPQTYSKDCLYFTPTGFTCGFLNADIGEQTSLGAEANNCISINNVMGVRSIDIVSPGAVGIQGGIIGLSANNINVPNGGVIYMTSATDFSDIRAGSSSSYTSLQSVLDAKVTSVRVNGTSYSPTNGVVDLGTISGGGSGGSSVTFRVW